MERLAHRSEVSKDQTQEFGLVVKAASPKKKLSTQVPADQVFSFEQKLTQMMQQSMFRHALERMEKAKKQQKKKGGDKVDATKGGKRTAPGKIKKNRKERRKDIRK